MIQMLWSVGRTEGVEAADGMEFLSVKLVAAEDTLSLPYPAGHGALAWLRAPMWRPGAGHIETPEGTDSIGLRIRVYRPL
jgi:hypothetical protein